ncbi:MAG: DUF6600 domain-containing protein [Candidatus Acidiferrales bacterium]
MKKIVWLLPLLIVATLFMGISNPVAAQEDPPSRVARLNYMQGSVSFQPSGEQDWVRADPNRPLTTGDNLWADKDSRGEVHIGSTAIRLSSETGISFLNLDDRTVQLQLAQGTIEVHLRNHEPGNAFEIDTPNLALTLTVSGEYLVESDPNGSSTVVVVREGAGQVTGGGETYTLEPGQQYTFTGTDQLTYDAEGAPGFDDFENWCQSRDQRENNSESARYVSRDVDGYYDLDDYGTWQSNPDYGEVWVPRGVAVGWAPYHLGHWVWIAPWGWTWVDAQPWGFAPFHYGRWAYIGNYWGWVPGPMVVRPVYAPALVGFVGGGGGFSLSVAFGGGFSGVAWFPLGPRDVYIPGYRCSPRYVQNVNITNTRVVNVTQVTNVYNTTVINRNVSVTRVNYTYANDTRAITAVPRDTFVNARPVSGASVRVTTEQLRSVRTVQAAPLAPTRASYVSATAKPVNARPVVPFAQRPVVARLNPAASINRTRPVEITNDSKPFSNGATANRVNSPQTPVRENEMAKPAAPNANEPPARPDDITTRYRPGNQNQVQGTGNNPNRANAAAPPVRENQTVKPSTTSTNESPARAGNQNQVERTNNNPPVERNSTKNNNPPPAQPQYRQPEVRFAPPVKAKDEMYDVHPPLNQRPPQAPKQQERRTQQAPRPPAHEGKPPHK